MCGTEFALKPASFFKEAILRHGNQSLSVLLHEQVALRLGLLPLILNSSSFTSNPPLPLPASPSHTHTPCLLGTSSLLVHMTGRVHIGKLLSLHWLGCPVFALGESMCSRTLGSLGQKWHTRVRWALLLWSWPL